jgi:ribonuclease HII
MPWVVGLDEAGYGPNLGPFVMSLVAFRVPEHLAAANLWDALAAAVRPSAGADDGRIVVDDSKAVYSSTGGLHALERGVLATLWHEPSAPPAALRHLVEWLCPQGGGLTGEAWFAGDWALPAELPADALPGAAAAFADTCAAAAVGRALVRSDVVCAPRFNALLDRHESKAAVLAESMTELLRAVLEQTPGDEPVTFFIDKHGGRNSYAALIQHALPDGVVVARAEGMNRSAYRVVGLKREVELTFQPRADAEHFCVALASMASKYLREALMLEFNRFWKQHVPDLKPTAGYPGDAARFYKAIRPAMDKLGIAEAAVWRRK